VEGIKEAVIDRPVTKSITQRVTSNFAWSVLSEATGKGVFFITNIYLARILGVENYGLFTLAQIITFYFWLAVDFGTNMYGIREIAKDKENAEEIINPLLTLRITAGFIVFSFYVSTLFLIDIPATKKFAFVGCGFFLLSYSFYTDWVLKGLEKFKFIAFGSLVSSTAFLIGTIYFVKSNEGVVAASFIWSFSYLLGSLSLLYFLYKKLGIKYWPSFNLKIWFSHMRESIYFTISGGLMVVYQYLPILLIGIFLSNYEVGLYSAAYRITLVTYGLIQILLNSFYPLFSETFSVDIEKFKKLHLRYIKMVLPLLILIALIGSIQGSNIIDLIFGSQYVRSASIFKISVWLLPLYFLRNAYWIIFSISNEWKNYFFVCIMGGIIFCITGFILVQKIGIIGAPIALLISEFIVISQLFMILRIQRKLI
jgi:O-antigen/teichoic acid export membrane protein